MNRKTARNNKKQQAIARNVERVRKSAEQSRMDREYKQASRPFANLRQLMMGG